MRSFIRFTKRTSDRALESEFRAAYQGAGVPYLFLAFVLSCLGFSAYYVLDMHAGAPVTGGVQTVRIFVASTFAGLALLLKLRPDVATPYYTLLANTTLLFGVLMADWVTARNHGHGPGTELLWNMNTTILATTLVVFGASRLTLLNTTAIAASGIVAGIVTLVALSAPLDGVARVTVNVLVIATTALTFRFRGENREWDLFVLAKENYNNSEGNKTKMRFLANMSHEVRTPLIGLIQIIDLVGASASAADRKLISKAKASGAALLNLLNGVLDYSALTTAGASRVVLAPTDLTAVCTTALSLHMAAISVKGLELRTRMDLGPTDVRVMTDGVLLFEIINNLMSNAIKFTDSGFLDLTVELRASPTSPSPLAMFRVEVVDTGIGISEENIQQIFAPFYQVDTSTSRKVGGTGLGLSIVKGLVDSLGGTITATSQVNVGTTMKVELPVEVVVQGTVNVLGGRRVWKNRFLRTPRLQTTPSKQAPSLTGGFCWSRTMKSTVISTRCTCPASVSKCSPQATGRRR